MICQKNNMPFFLGILLIVPFIQGATQDFDGRGTQMTLQEREIQRQALFEKAMTDSKDFSYEEIRDILYTVCLAEDGLDEDYHIAMRKIIDLGESIYPLLSEEALKSHEEKWGKEDGGRIAAGIVTFFGRSEEKGDKTEARKTTLKVFEKFPKECIALCRVMGNIGEPEDVPQLLAFIDQDNGTTLVNVLRAVAKIAAVSQIPDIEKAVAEWDKKYPARNKEQQKYDQVELKKCLTSIRERNVQWTPPSAPKNNDKKKNGDADDASPTTTFSYWFFSVVIGVLIFGGIVWRFKSALFGIFVR